MAPINTAGTKRQVITQHSIYQAIQLGFRHLSLVVLLAATCDGVTHVGKTIEQDSDDTDISAK